MYRFISLYQFIYPVCNARYSNLRTRFRRNIGPWTTVQRGTSLFDWCERKELHPFRRLALEHLRRVSINIKFFPVRTIAFLFESCLTMGLVAGASVFENTTDVTSYSYNPTTEELVSYDTPNIVKMKAQYVNANGLAGAMYWDLIRINYAVRLGLQLIFVFSLSISDNRNFLAIQLFATNTVRSVLSFYGR